ncbi:MAG: hypothetical protein WC429_18615, partial [Verrucomicrobiia bacterium]
MQARSRIRNKHSRHIGTSVRVYWTNDRTEQPRKFRNPSEKASLLPLPRLLCYATNPQFIYRQQSESKLCHAASGCGVLRRLQRATGKKPMDFSPNTILKVSVLQSGKLLADGSETSLADLDARMTQIQSRNGVVYYYREGGLGEP